MTWQYRQHDGEFLHDGVFIGTGYSGSGIGRNDTSYQDVHDVGPLPCGTYTIGQPFTDPEKGPLVFSLIPSPNDEMFGRSGFLIHGDNRTSTASPRC